MSTATGRTIAARVYHTLLATAHRIPVSPTVTNTTCLAGQGLKLMVTVYLMGDGGVENAGQASHLLYTGLTPKGRGDAVWAESVFEVAVADPGFENVGCAIGLPPEWAAHRRGTDQYVLPYVFW